MKLQRVFLRMNNVKFAVSTYFVVSSLFSLSIFLRLNFAPNDWIKNANVAFYFLTYTGASIASVWYMATTLSHCEKQPETYKRSFRIFLAYLALLSAALLPLSGFGLVPEWLFLVVPVFLAFLTYIMLMKQKRTLSKRLAQFAGLLLVISAFLPIATAFACQNQVLADAASISDSNQKVQVIGSFVQNMVTYNIYRSDGDFWKYLLVGTGSCGESAMASTTLLKDIGFDARIVVLPGEDHAFTEVNINGTWMVIDPGYNITSPITREQRADMRIAEMGAISYVITYSGSNFTELTSLYVPTDTITIKVTNGGTPLANAQVYLLHEFRNGTKRLPDTDASFFTNATGEITFHLGTLTYNQNASRYDTCYWIYVNGKNTGYNVTSTGTGTMRLVEINVHQ